MGAAHSTGEQLPTTSPALSGSSQQQLRLELQRLEFENTVPVYRLVYTYENQNDENRSVRGSVHDDVPDVDLAGWPSVLHRAYGEAARRRRRREFLSFASSTSMHAPLQGRVARRGAESVTT